MADALSRKYESERVHSTLMVLSYLTLDWLEDLKNFYVNDPIIQSIIPLIEEGPDVPRAYTMQNEALMRNGKIFLKTNSILKQ